ncbi:MAG: GcrA family cell cycle regulator [Parvibaculales bacterium]
MAWTEDRVAQLKRLWMEGLSASQIATEMGGGISRNAVIGKVHRLGLSGRSNRNTVSTPKIKTAAVKPEKKEKRAYRRKAGFSENSRSDDIGFGLTEEKQEEPSPQNVTLLHLKSRQCRWPIEGEDGSLYFCGKAAKDKLPYCEKHAEIAYQSPAKLRKKA